MCQVRKTLKNIIFHQNRDTFNLKKMKKKLESSKNGNMSKSKHIAPIYEKKVTYAVKIFFSSTVAAEF